VKRGDLKPDEITDKTISQHLYTKEIPDPDFMIRTSGEQRISNFLLWQLSYAEFYFSETAWPDFREKEFLDAIEIYKKRHRRFGDIK
jgi:undecaprenyl diphosphate synthase